MKFRIGGNTFYFSVGIYHVRDRKFILHDEFFIFDYFEILTDLKLDLFVSISFVVDEPDL